MHIYTTLDLKMQTAARKALDDNLGGTDRSGDAAASVFFCAPDTRTSG